MQKNKTRNSTEALVLGAIFTALVIVLQFVGQYLRFTAFSITLVLVPIVICSAMCGPKESTWLGIVFGAIVLMTDASAFLAISIPGTVITVMLKGALCGLAAGLVYKLLEDHNKHLAVYTAALVCPIVNTGVFLLGCRLFFFDAIGEWAAGEGMSTFQYMIFGLVGINFLIEVAINIILGPAIVRILNISKK